jgi:integrase
MPTRRSNGQYYIQRTLAGVGKLYKSLSTSSKGRADVRERMLVTLDRQGHKEIMRAFQAGAVSISVLEEHFEAQKLHILRDALRTNSVSLKKACDEALKNKKPDIRATTLSVYEMSLAHFRSFIDNDDLPVHLAMTEDRIQEFKGRRLDGGRAEQTVNNDLGAISVVVSFAMKKGWMKSRPEIKKFKYKARIRWLDAGQLALYSASLRPAFRTQMLTLIGSAMRLGESESLTVSDLRLGSEGRALIEDSKTAEGVRAVYLPTWVVELLQKHIDEHGLSGQDQVFTIHRRTVQAEHKRACGIAGIYGYTIHDHRHTAAVHLARAGMPIPLLQQQLGHTNLDQTMKYARFHPEYGDVADYFSRVADSLGISEIDSRNNKSHNTPQTEGTDAAY